MPENWLQERIAYVNAKHLEVINRLRETTYKPLIEKIKSQEAQHEDTHCVRV